VTVAFLRRVQIFLLTYLLTHDVLRCKPITTVMSWRRLVLLEVLKYSSITHTPVLWVLATFSFCFWSTFSLAVNLCSYCQFWLYCMSLW